MEFEIANSASDHKFRTKELKLEIQELQIKLRHAENKITKSDDHNQRMMEDASTKHMNELENIKREHSQNIDIMSEKSQMNLSSLKDTYQS